MIILKIHIIVSYDQNISLIFFVWKMDLMSGFDIRLVFTLPPRDSTLQYKTCVLFYNNFPCIIILVITLFYVDALNSEFNLHWNAFFSAPRPAMQSLFLAAAQCSYKVRNAIFFQFLHSVLFPKIAFMHVWTLCT